MAYGLHIRCVKPILPEKPLEPEGWTVFSNIWLLNRDLVLLRGDVSYGELRKK